MKKYKNILMIIFLIYALYFLTGCAKNSDKDLHAKVISELDYVNVKTIDLLNELNNISFENYWVVSEQVKLSGEEQQNQTSSKGGSSGQSSQQGGQNSAGGESGGGSESKMAGGSSDTKGSEEKQEEEGESQDKVNTTKMVTEVDLDRDRNNIDWSKIKKEIELLNESWSVIVLDLYALDVNNDNILSFSDKLNKVMIAVKEENKVESLGALADLYSNIPQFLEEINADKNMQKIRQTQSYVINAYVLADDMENTVINEHLTNAVSIYSEIMSDIDYIKDKTEKTNKIYVLLNEMINSLDEKDSDLFYIKYKNFMKEIETV